MGDRYQLGELKCPYCGETQEDVYYAESCGNTTHICENEKCKKESIISLDFVLQKRSALKIENKK